MKHLIEEKFKLLKEFKKFHNEVFENIPAGWDLVFNVVLDYSTNVLSEVCIQTNTHPNTIIDMFKTNLEKLYKLRREKLNDSSTT